MYENLAILAVFAFLYSIASGGLEKTLFSGAVVFTAFGFVFGPLGWALTDQAIQRAWMGL